jgi:hypothetical protein
MTPSEVPPAEVSPAEVPQAGVSVPAVPAPRAGLVRTILGRDDDDDDRPLPELPPLPEDPRWRIEHLPFVSAAGVALVLCAASAGFFAGGSTAAVGAAAGVLVVLVGVTLTTLSIAWADAIRPALVMPVGLLVYLVKYALIIFVLFGVTSSGWAGARPMVWGVAVGAVVLTAVQAWWLTRLAGRHIRSAVVRPNR